MSHDRPQTNDLPEFQANVLAQMRRWRREGAHWTSDLAHGLSDIGRKRVPTPKVRRALEALERAGLVRRVVTGNPTSWEMADEQS